MINIYQGRIKNRVNIQQAKWIHVIIAEIKFDMKNAQYKLHIIHEYFFCGHFCAHYKI